jgi:hypothetical protein
MNRLGIPKPRLTKEHWLSSKFFLSWRCCNSSKCSQIWLKLVFGGVELRKFPSWYQKVGFLVWSQMGSQKTPCCKVTSVNFGKGSHINYGNWNVPMSSSIFFIAISSTSLLWNVMIMLSAILNKSGSKIGQPFLAFSCKNSSNLFRIPLITIGEIIHPNKRCHILFFYISFYVIVLKQ